MMSACCTLESRLIQTKTNLLKKVIHMNYSETQGTKQTRDASTLLRFDQEWISLQAQYEQYERSSLLIKLTCVVLFALALMFPMNVLLAAAFVLIFWLQEGIFKTFQARLADRLLQVEGCLRDPEMIGFAYQLHSEWQKNRPSGIGLIIEYIKNSARPTVAFPYVVLLLLDIFVYLLW